MNQRTVNRSRETERLVATDVFLHQLDADTLEALRHTLEQGLMPSSLEFTGDGSIAILRFTRR